MPAITDLLDSDMETNHFIDENSLISSVSDTTALAQAKEEKKPRKRVCVGMPKKKKSKTPDLPKPQTQATKRKPLPKETLDEDDLVETQPTKPRGRKPARPQVQPSDEAPKPKRKPRQKVPDQIEDNDQVPDLDESDALHLEAPSPVNIRSNFAGTTKRTNPKPVLAKSKVQNPDPTPSDEEDAVQPRKRQRIEQPSTYRAHRAGSVSSTGSRAGANSDPLLRRKLGDITSKYQNIDHKYRNLKDVAIAEANDNLDKMRRQCDAVTAASDALVTSLKAQLAAQTPLLAELKALKKEKSTKDSELEQAKKSRDSEIEKLKQANEQVTKALGVAQTEVKVLQSKLAAKTSVPAESKAKKPQPAEHESIPQLKIDLYGDLTGLIIRGVKQGPDGDTYDCIQTGRNGSKFQIPNITPFQTDTNDFSTAF